MGLATGAVRFGGPRISSVDVMVVMFQEQRLQPIDKGTVLGLADQVVFLCWVIGQIIEFVCLVVTIDHEHPGNKRGRAIKGAIKGDAPH